MFTHVKNYINSWFIQEVECLQCGKFYVPAKNSVCNNDSQSINLCSLQCFLNHDKNNNNKSKIKKAIS